MTIETQISTFAVAVGASLLMTPKADIALLIASTAVTFYGVISDEVNRAHGR